MPGISGNESKGNKRFLSNVSHFFPRRASSSGPDAPKSTVHGGELTNGGRQMTRTETSAIPGQLSSSARSSSPMPVSRPASGLMLTDKAKLALQGLHEFLKVVEKSADWFPLLKSPLAAVNACIRVYETVSGNREEAEHQLEQLRELSELLAMRAQYGVRPLIHGSKNMTQTLDRARTILQEVSSQSTTTHYAMNADFANTIRICYRNVTDALRQFQLELGIQQERTTMDILKEAVLARLETSKDAPYTSASSGAVERQGCTPGTRHDILQRIIEWAKSSDPVHSLFWLYGLAGIGKTAIALTLCENLKDHGFLASSYFCSIQLDSRNSKYIASTIARHLASISRAFAVELVSQLQADPDIAHSTLRLQLDGLLCAPWNSSAAIRDSLPHQPLVVVIDALDECDHGVEFLTHLLEAVDNGELHGLKFFVTSRPVPKLIEKWQSKATQGHQIALHEVERDLVDRDIRQYLQNKLDGLKSADVDINALVSASGGLFIFASTVVKYIFPSDSELTPSQQVRRLHSIQSQAPGTVQGIDELYARVVNTALPRREQPTQDQSKEFEERLTILHAIISLEEPQSAEVIAELVEVDVEIVCSVVSAMHSVLYTSADGRIHLFHASFHDFIIDPKRSSSYCCDIPFTHLPLARKCLQTMCDRLRFNICHLESSFTPDEELHPPLELRIHQYIGPLLTYSCKHWWAHFQRCNDDGRCQLRPLVRTVLQEQGIFWIEVMSLLGYLPACKLNLEECAFFRAMPDISPIAKVAAELVTVFISLPPPRITSHLYLSILATWKERAVLEQWVSQLSRLPRVLQRQLDGRQYCKMMANAGSPVRCVTFSPDGKQVFSGSEDHTIRIWDVESGEELHCLKGHSDWIYSVALSHDGKRLASGSGDDTIRIWNTEEGEEIYRIEAHLGSVRSVAFSPDGKKIVSGSSDRTIIIWDIEEGRESNRLEGHTHQVLSVARSPDGKQVLSGSVDHTIRIWDAQAGGEVHRLMGHADRVLSVAFSPDGKRVVSGSRDATVRIWAIESSLREELHCLNGHTDSVTSVAFSLYGERIVSGSYDRTIRIWNAKSGEETHRFEGHTHWVSSIAFSPDAFRVVSGSNDKTIRVWDVETDKKIHGLEGHIESVQSVAFSYHGKQIVSGSADKTVRIWDVEAEEEVRCLKGHTSSVSAVAFSPDGTRVVSGSGDKTIRIWDCVLGKEIRCLEGHKGIVRSVAFSNDGMRIASGSNDKMICIWNPQSGVETHRLKGHTHWVSSVAFSPDSTRVLSGSYDETIRIWDAKSGVETHRLNGHIHWVSSVAFSPDGNRVVSGSGDNTIRVWDVETGKEIHCLEGHTHGVLSVSFSYNCKRVVSGSGDKTVRIWDVEAEKEIHCLRGHTSSVWSTVFSPDCKRIASASRDKAVLIWDAEMRNDEGCRPFSTVAFLSSQAISPLPHSTLHLEKTGLSHYTRADGWVVTSKERVGSEEKLLWLPPALRPFNPPVLKVFARGGMTRIDLNDCVFGLGWSQCYSGNKEKGKIVKATVHGRS